MQPGLIKTWQQNVFTLPAQAADGSAARPVSVQPAVRRTHTIKPHRKQMGKNNKPNDYKKKTKHTQGRNVCLLW